MRGLSLPQRRLAKHGAEDKSCSASIRIFRVFVTSLYVFLTFSSVTRAQQLEQCAPINADVRLRVLHSVQRLFHTEPILPVIDDERFVPSTCFWQVSVSVPNSDKHWVLYLSPDRRFLSGTLLDVSVDPIIADEKVSLRLKREIEKDQPPIRGPDGAPVTIVVFSDFQCPYCTAFHEVVERYRKTNPDRVRLVFRNLPLPVHDWAVQAARAGVCMSQQSLSAFWKYHDLILSKQKSLTAENLPTTITELLANTPEVRGEGYSKCVNSGFPERRLGEDLAEARSLNVDATPTIFINGRKYTSFRDDAAFSFAINLATPTQPSKTGIPSSAGPK